MISAIITTYKREPYYINRAINSVLNQTYKDIEILVVDDSPADYPLRETVKKTVLEKGNKSAISIQYIAHKRNLGACAARNTGMDLANGEYIAYLDDDDEWMPDKLKKQIAMFSSDDIALVYCGRICKNDITDRITNENIEYHQGDVFKKLLYMNFIGSTSFPLIRTKCLKEVGGFDVKMESAQDIDVWIRIAQKYKVAFVDEPLVIYHVHPGEQITSNPHKKISGLERLNEKYNEYIDDANTWYRRHIIITPYYALAGEKKKAIHTWMKCVRKCPGKIMDNMKYLRLIMKGIKRQNNE